MRSSRNKLASIIGTILGLAIFIVLLVLGFVFFTYLIIIGVVLGLILFVIGFVRAKFLGKKMQKKHVSKQQAHHGRTIDHDDH